MICLFVSYFIEARIKRVGRKDAIFGSLSVILIIIGLIVACFGCFLLPNTQENIPDNSIIIQNSTSNSSLFASIKSDETKNISVNESILTYSQQAVNTSNFIENVSSGNMGNSNAKPLFDEFALGLGVIGFGIALLAFGLGNLTAIESKYEFQELKTHVIEGPYFARRFKKKLTPMDCMKIYGFWALIGLIIVITNLLTSQSTFLINIRIIIGFIFLIIGIIAIVYGLKTRERNISDTVQVVLTQLKSR